jgi:hypothetical protein
MFDEALKHVLRGCVRWHMELASPWKVTGLFLSRWLCGDRDAVERKTAKSLKIFCTSHRYENGWNLTRQR